MSRDSLPVLGFDTRAGVRVDLDRLISSRLLIQANSGGGKSRALRYVLEQTHGKVQQIVLDPEGEFATLRERFDYVLAGRDGDIAAHPKTAKVVARRLMQLGASAIIDLYDLTLEERRRFVRLFLEELMHLPRDLWRPLLVAIDEAHVFAPEQGQSESLAAVVALCTQGRKRGYCALLATQRLSKLHKDAAAELLNKLIGRTGLDVDVKRAGDELGFDKEQRQTLKFLEPGTFYTYGPAIAREVTQVRTGDVVTTHPEPGQVAPPAPPAPKAVQKLLGELAELQQQADEELRTIEDRDRAIAQLRKDLRAAQKGAPAASAPDPAAVQKQIERALGDERRRHARQLDAIRKQATARDAVMRRRLDGIVRGAREVVGLADVTIEPLELPDSGGNDTAAPAPAAAARPLPSSPSRPAAAAPAPRSSAPAVRVDGITPAQQRMLNALAVLESIGVTPAPKPTLGAFSGYSNTSGGAFTNNLGRLSTGGLIAYPSPGTVALTDEGRAAAAPVDEPPTLAELHEKWLALVPPALGRVLQALLDAYPEALTKQELGDRTGYGNTSGGAFTNNLGRLSTMGALTYPSKGMVRASELLFPEGLS